MKKNLYKKLLILLVLVYVVFTLINQQKVLNQYNKNNTELSAQIQQEKQKNTDLVAEKDNINSKEFIEETAREMLDMYYPNEKVYIDKGM